MLALLSIRQCLFRILTVCKNALKAFRSPIIRVWANNCLNRCQHDSLDKLIVKQLLALKSKKVYDKFGNRRLVTVAFRASVEESNRLNELVQASGMSKQDYIISRLECLDVVVQGNPKVYIGLKRLLQSVEKRLEVIEEKAVESSPYLLDTINYIL